ncbi:MAG: hypothetical protein ACK5HY_11335 [Parahaliea sp.]
MALFDFLKKAFGPGEYAAPVDPEMEDAITDDEIFDRTSFTCSDWKPIRNDFEPSAEFGHFIHDDGTYYSDI